MAQTEKIIVRKGTYAFPEGHTVAPAAAVKSLRQVTVEEAELEASISQAQAALALKRVEAVQIQDEFERLRGVRDKKSRELARAKSGLEVESARLAQIEADLQGALGADDWASFHDIRVEHANRTFVVDRLPKFITTTTEELTKAEKVLADFERKHLK